MTEKTDHDLIVEIHSILLGSNGYDGLCQDHEKLKKVVYGIVVAVVFIAGASGYSLAELLRFLK